MSRRRERPREVSRHFIAGLIAHRLLVGVTDGARHLAEARDALDREANARRWLVEALGSLDVGQEGRGGPFTGRVDRVEFGTWLRVADGWLEYWRVTLTRDGEQLLAVIASAERGTRSAELVLREGVEDVAFDYLLDPGADARWVREWISPVSAPLALRLRVRYRGSGKGEAGSVDTLLLIIGPRG